MPRMRRKPKPKPRKFSKKDCHFCKNKKEPHWSESQFLAEYLSPRSRILPRSKTGICAKHQRRLAEAIKHGRHLGLLSFITQVS